MRLVASTQRQMAESTQPVNVLINWKHAAMQDLICVCRVYTISVYKWKTPLSLCHYLLIQEHVDLLCSVSLTITAVMPGVVLVKKTVQARFLASGSCVAHDRVQAWSHNTGLSALLNSCHQSSLASVLFPHVYLYPLSFSSLWMKYSQMLRMHRHRHTTVIQMITSLSYGPFSFWTVNSLNRVLTEMEHRNNCFIAPYEAGPSIRLLHSECA